MAFFDKLSQAAKSFGDKAVEVGKNIGDKASDAVEIAKLNSKISTAKNAANAELLKMGQYFYEQFAAGKAVDPAVQEFCQKAKEQYGIIAQAQADIERVKAEKGGAPAAAAQDAPAQPEAAPVPVMPDPAQFEKAAEAVDEAVLDEQIIEE